ncbi:MAG: hypothetical protein HeimC3_06350 [Candidatus Heimdallarchaeota archaeon LC_3]|nr:MAG: hypothetical protein HeimC3_06350 [Candidatus Heimdallarchaeota archaeon LC_3]
MRNFSFFSRYDIFFSSLLVDNYKKKTLINFIIKNFSKIISFLYLLSIFVFITGIIFNNFILLIFLLILLWLPFLFVNELLRYKILIDIRNLNFLGIFLIHEFKLILETTQSMEYAVDYFLESISNPIKKTSFNIMQMHLIKGKYPEEALILLIEEMNLTLLVSSLQKIIDDWHSGRLGKNDNENYLQRNLENQIDLYNKFFITWSSLISATITILPLFSFFLLLVLDFKTWEFFLILISYMVLITILFHILDPFSLKFLKQFGFSDNFIPNSLSAASFMEELANNLQVDPDAANAIKYTIFKLYNDKKIHLEGLAKFSNEKIKHQNINSNHFNLNKDVIKQMLTSLMLGISTPSEILKNLLPSGIFKHIKLVLEFVKNGSSIDVSSTINHLYLLSYTQSRLEQALQQRVILIKSEYRKTSLLLILQSCALGLLLGLEPFFLTIKNFTNFHDLASFYSSFTNLNGNFNIILTLLFAGLYLAFQILTFKAVYVTPTLERLIFYLFIQIFCVYSGFSIVTTFMALNT